MGNQLQERKIATDAQSNKQRDERPPILRLTVDCSEEIFDYLQVNDLHAIGQTRKSLLRASGDYFQRNYASELVRFSSGNIRYQNVELNEFKHFVLAMEISYPSFHRLKSFPALKIVYIILYGGGEIAKLENRIMKQIDEMAVDVKVFDEKDYEILRNSFPNMIRLRLYCREIKRDDDAANNPKIEYFSYMRSICDVPVKTFFNHFPNLREFECYDLVLLANATWFKRTSKKIS